MNARTQAQHEAHAAAEHQTPLKHSPLRITAGGRLLKPAEVRSIDNQITLVFTLAQAMPHMRLLPLRAYREWTNDTGMAPELNLYTANSYAATFAVGSPVMCTGEGLRLVRDGDIHTDDHLRIINCAEVCLIKPDSMYWSMFQ